MRITKEQRKLAEIDLSHWGDVARKRWQAQPRQVHQIARMMELGVVSGPTNYDAYYEYDADERFTRVNRIVVSMAEEDRTILVAHYLDRKPWKKLYKLLGLENWWHVGKQIRAAEAKYFLLSEKLQTTV